MRVPADIILNSVSNGLFCEFCLFSAKTEKQRVICIMYCPHFVLEALKGGLHGFYGMQFLCMDTLPKRC